MQSIRTLVVDDEPLARDKIIGFLTEEPDIGQTQESHRDIVTAHIDKLEAGLLHDHRMKRRGDARRHDIAVSPEKLSEFRTHAHCGSSPCGQRSKPILICCHHQQG